VTPPRPAGRGFARGVALTFGTNVAVLAIGVATSVVSARLLGPDRFGEYAVAQLFAFIVITFSNCGLAPATIYHVSRGTHPLRDVVVNGVLFSLAAGTVAIAVGASVAWLFGGRLMPGLTPPVLMVALLLVPVTHVGTTLRAVLHGQQRFGALSVATAADMAARFAAMVVGVGVLHGGVRAAVAANVLGALAVALGTLVYLRRELAGARWRFDTGYLRESLRYGSKAFLANSVQFLNYRVDMLLLNVWHGPVAVGFYSIAVLFAERLGMISGAASTVLFPRVAASGDGHTDATPTVARVVFWSTAACALGFLAISGPLVHILYSSAFAAAVAPLRILLIGMVALSAAEVVAHDFSGRGRPEVNTVIAAGTLVVNVAVCLVLVPRFGTIGAAWATALVYCAQGMVFIGYYVHVSGKRVLDVLVLRREDLVRIRGIFAPRRPAAAEL
jgi:O-antigen/teichoic acid export membrane protein